MSNALVTIIVPCYNMSKTLPRYFNSVLNQSYKNIQVLAIDDGSVDNTREIILKYQPLFCEEGMELKYIYQQNEGLGAAINTGLKYIAGEFLCWSDPDDFYFPESIKKRIEILQDNPEYGVVSSDAYVYYADDLIHPIKREAARFEHRFEKNQFEYLLYEQSHFCAGCHMIRMSAFNDVNPEHEIYPAKRGQNWQLLLPVYYKYSRYYLDEPLYAYIVSPNSMSKGDITERRELARWDEHEKIIEETLGSMQISKEKKDNYLKSIAMRYAKKRFYTAIDYRDFKLLKTQYSILKINGALDQELINRYRQNHSILSKILYKIFGKYMLVDN
ncbi:MAG: glycosyltransferase family 2 protein [Lachnospiraceae bacterium]|nr:glycosyltransferase family 2 protein [Lachnospiraceae bacterium]